MKKFFNTTGPCNPVNHYMIDPIQRAGDLEGLIDQQSYFVIHAPRQSGKTTLLEALAQKLTAEGKYAAMRFSCEMGSPFRDNIEKVELVLMYELRQVAKVMLPKELWPRENWEEAPTGARINSALAHWAETCPRPLVLFLDEIDALTNESLESVLKQHSVTKISQILKCF